ncbi:MAG TPA: hypothetical protein VFN22_01895 [Gemmatimonadales bacterium]|nr:hypothetical protein [Gemmatimonadales bacterium]
MSPPDRLRPPPDERLAAPVTVVDLSATARRLRAEPHAAVSGHRQIAVFRHGPVTLVSFAFDAGGALKQHHAEGVVTIHAISGHLRVMAGGTSHDLHAGQLIGLATSVPHTVEAIEASEMLLTVCLDSRIRGEP